MDNPSRKKLVYPTSFGIIQQKYLGKNVDQLVSHCGGRKGTYFEKIASKNSLPLYSQGITPSS
jgi:hypothetical protein